MLQGYFLSPGFVLEVNVLLMAVCIVFMVDLYNHLSIKSTTLPNIKTTFYIIGLDARISWLRAISLIGYLLNAIVGVRMAISPSRYKFAAYMLTGLMVFITMLSIGVSRYASGVDGQFYANLMLEDLWQRNLMESLEYELDCCGKNGAIDYEIANRTWSPASCCGSPNCFGCQKPFFAYLYEIEMEIARDNIISLIFLGIGLLLMFAHYAVIMLDHKISEEDERDEDEMLEQMLR